MITIYHNPKCSKSREGVCLLESLNQPFEIITYLNAKITKRELQAILKKLNITPIELVRTKESLWREEFKDQQLSDTEIIDVLLKHPILIERPIVINGKKAVIARPTERILEII